MNDLLWSDPHNGQGFLKNPRGCSVQFGVDVVEEFLRTNGLKLLVRSHQVKDQGYEIIG